MNRCAVGSSNMYCYSEHVQLCVSFPLQTWVSQQVHHHSVCQPLTTIPALLLPSKGLPPPDIPVEGVSKDLCLYPLLMGLLGYVLCPGESTLITDHALINEKMLSEEVAVLEIME